MLTPAVFNVEGVGGKRIRANTHPPDPPEGVYMATVPRCLMCGRPHLETLECWRGKYAADTTALVLALMGNACWSCGRVAATADHIKPRSRGGSDALDNMRPACRSCNSRRGNADPSFPPDAPTVREVPASRRWA